ncbi:hypothetical protein [Oryza sativa Japonica Group]|uniref:Uncharacterized protein n=1 Tax=Oryza sativa subsp. japonica TaxID=39947 RepID=Q5ZBK6_ORYSJ|nr:hypothetical protein [Oryza sativa Japonica Group]BAD53066.1 hypothetical protein [Oryza sativa Japonica Group]
MAEANTTKTQPPGPHQRAWNLQCDACKKVMTTKMSSSPFLSSETRFSPKKSTLKQQGEGGGINDIAFRKEFVAHVPHRLDPHCWELAAPDLPPGPMLGARRTTTEYFLPLVSYDEDKLLFL